MTAADADVAPGPSGPAPPGDASGPPEAAGPGGEDVGGPPPAVRSARSVRVLVVVAGSVAVVAGVAMRVWLLAHTPINSDEAVVGLMARQILHGHFSAFYWGQAYGGAEPYVVAAVFAVFGQSALTLQCSAVLLSVVAAVLTWRVVARLVPGERAVALLAGALVWTAPAVNVFNSTREYGFRGVTTACGLALLLAVLRIADGHRSLWSFALCGLVAGIGWWSSPEVVYYALPAALILAGVVWRRRADGAAAWAERAVALVAAAGLGAAPWLWANASSHFASLRSANAPGGASPVNLGFVGRLHVFFRFSLPMEAGLRRPSTGLWLFGNAGSGAAARLVLGGAVVVVAAAVVASLVACWWRGGRAAALAVAVVLFPLLYAASPATWYWQDGRYAVFLGPLVAMTLAVGCVEGARRLGRVGRHTTARAALSGGVALAVVVLVATGLSLTSFWRSTHGVAGASFVESGNPNGPTLAAIAALEAGGVRDATADYWVAYKVDFLSHGRLSVGTAPGDVDRWSVPQQAVAGNPRAAYLFVPASELATGLVQFGFTDDIVGPAGLSEAQVTGGLDRLGVPYRVVDAGLLRAVVPARAVAFSALAAPG